MSAATALRLCNRKTESEKWYRRVSFLFVLFYFVFIKLIYLEVGVIRIRGAIIGRRIKSSEYIYMALKTRYLNMDAPGQYSPLHFLFHWFWFILYIAVLGMVLIP